jgi:ABC-type dipeptide/oligopeptide/nickel transport system ATPase component
MSAAPELTVARVAEARGISVSFGGEVILDRIDLVVEAPSELVVSGRSGSGKTTLLLVLAGLLAPSSGAVNWPGLVADPVLRRHQVAMIFQAPSLIAELTAAENIALPLRLRGMTQQQAQAVSLAVLDDVGLTIRHGAALPSEMSGGEQQRVAVARALATRPRLMLADEPTGALDREHARAIIDVLRSSTRRNGAALVVSTHDRDVAAEFAVEVVVDDGTLEWVRP